MTNARNPLQLYISCSSNHHTGQSAKFYYMTILAHITDVHLPPVPRPNILQLSVKQTLGYMNWLRERQRHHDGEVLSLMREDLLNQEVSHILCSGDVVNIALAAEFEQALVWIRSLGASDHVSFTPGNHDYYGRQASALGLAKFAHYMSSDERGRALGGADWPQSPFVRVINDAAIIGVNSGIETPPFKAFGKIAPTTLEKLGRILQEAKEVGLYRCLMLHHPPLSSMTGVHRGLKNADEFERLIVNAGAEIVLYGHNHRYARQSLTTIDGDCAMISTPSFSMAAGQRYDAARYNLIRFERADGAWRTELIGRGIDKSGQVTEVERVIL